MRYTINIILCLIIFTTSCRSIHEGLYAEEKFYSDPKLCLEKDKKCFVETKKGEIIETDRIALGDFQRDNIIINEKRYKLDDLKTVQNSAGYYAFDEDLGWVVRTYKGRLDVYKISIQSSSMNMKTGRTTTINVKLPVVRNDKTGKLYYAYDYKNVKPLLESEKLCKPYLKKYRIKERNRKINRYANYTAMIIGLIGFNKLDPESASTPAQKQKRETPYLITGSLFLGGLSNWIMGGIWRTGLKRTPMIQAVYVYNFGKFPKDLKQGKNDKKR